eukprot:1077677-Prorocentrum_minimum.AAC.1
MGELNFRVTRWLNKVFTVNSTASVSSPRLPLREIEPSTLQSRSCLILQPTTALTKTLTKLLTKPLNY